jgi:hypothetical protein
MQQLQWAVSLMPEIVTFSGPLWDGRARRAIGDFLDAAAEEVAQQGVNEVKQMLGGVLKNPTGYYERHITTDRQQNGIATTDSGVIYGPWLEGVSSRNQTSRFKGYWTFRTIHRQLMPKVEQIAERVLRTYLHRMG